LQGDNIVTKQQEQILEQFQAYQQQAQNVLAQRNAFSLELRDINNALDELKKTEEEKVYKISGPLLIKSNKEEVMKELEERRDIIELRLKTLERQEAKIKEKLEELKEKIKGMGL